MKKQSAFTLVEVLVSLVVFALVIAGLSSVFIAGGKLITHNRERITSAELGRLFLDPLRSQVSYGTWNATDTTYGWNGAKNELRVGTRSGTSQTINNRIFDEQHVVSDASIAGITVRKVVSTVNWVESSP